MKLKFYVLFETPVMTVSAVGAKRCLGTFLTLHTQNLLKTAMSLYLATDFLVAASLCYYLHTSRTGLKRYDLSHLSNETHDSIHSSTDTIINKLIIYAINNGLLTGQRHSSILRCLEANDVYISVTDLLIIVFVSLLYHTRISYADTDVIQNRVYPGNLVYLSLYQVVANCKP